MQHVIGLHSPKTRNMKHAMRTVKSEFIFSEVWGVREKVQLFKMET